MDAAKFIVVKMHIYIIHPVSGVVEELDDAVASQTGLKRGDSVMALVGGGGYAGQPIT